jgi:lantibiotic biosynthesis protein
MGQKNALIWTAAASEFGLSIVALALLMTGREQGKMSINHCGFFVLRTPLLSFGEVRRWSDSLVCANLLEEDPEEHVTKEALEHDVSLLRSRLIQIVHRPEIRQALAIASPSLLGAISIWKRDPESKKGRQAERSLVRYFLRMCTRPTPFGLFSGCSVGSINPENTTVLELASRQYYRSATRLDFDYLFALTSALRCDPMLQVEMRYGWNSSLQRIGTDWHYVESRPLDTGRSHHLIKLGGDEYLNNVLSVTKSGNCRFEDLVAAIRSCHGSETLTNEEIDDYLRELINSEILVPNILPSVTGRSALITLLDELSGVPSAKRTYETLLDIQEHIVAFDCRHLGVDPEEYSVIATHLETLPAKVDRARLLQIDMFKPVISATLGQTVLDEVYSALRVLDKIVPAREPAHLARFRDDFGTRYEDEWVPLAEALDPDAGIGYGQTSSTGGSPLLRGLALAATKDQNDINLNKFQAILLQKILDCARTGEDEIELRAADFSSFEAADEERLPSSFCVIASLVASSLDALRNGNFDLIYKGGYGPSSVRLLGRFCMADPGLDALVRDALREEESHDPEAVYAEIVYLPEGRIGNVLCRPVLRDYEIVHLGRSGAPADRQLSAEDLIVTVRDGKIVLYSQRLRRRVIPRMSNAHNYGADSVSAIYRFLCDLQNQGGARVPTFDWGGMAKLSALPRVRMGRVVLARAQWHISTEESESLMDLDRHRAFLKLKKLQRDRRLPRWVWLAEGDNTLLVDFDNPLSVDAFLHVLRRSREAILVEMYPQGDVTCVTGPEGVYEHELLLPLSHKPVTVDSVAVPATREGTKQHIDSTLRVKRTERIFPPGNDWQYVKIYGGDASLDDVLTGELAPLLQKFSNSGIITRWFFIRYADPEKHLRLRFQTQNDDATAKLMTIINSYLIEGRVWRVQFDTYRREVVRYGGLEGIKASEEIFCADSEAVLAILQALNSEDGLDARWRIALLGMDTLFTDCGFDLKTKLELAGKLRSGFAKEFRLSVATREELGERFRSERAKLQAIMRREIAAQDKIIQLAIAAFEERSKRIRPAVADLRILEQRSSLETTFSEIVGSIVHMHVNRLLRSSHRAHECVLYDFLYRIYDSNLARMKNTDQNPMTLRRA